MGLPGWVHQPSGSQSPLPRGAERLRLATWAPSPSRLPPGRTSSTTSRHSTTVVGCTRPSATSALLPMNCSSMRVPVPL